MTSIATGFERAAAPRRSDGANGTRRVPHALLLMLDRLVAPPGHSSQGDLTPEWFKYPPF
jgi:hypothetical protein